MQKVDFGISKNKVKSLDKKSVRCWKYDLRNRGTIYISLPHPHYGYDLISCKKCGEIYCYSRESQTYKKSIAEKVKNIKCFKCNSELDDNYFLYPKNFINSSGKIDSFDIEIAYSIPEENSFFKKFYSIDD